MKFTDEAFLNWHAMYAEQIVRLDDISEIPNDPELSRTLKELSPLLADIMRFQRTKPYTFVRHDYHLGNLLFTESNGATEVMVIDWQDLSVGHGPLDVATLLGYSFPVEDRHAHEQELLQLYHDTLCKHGVTDYTFDQCWDDYRIGMFEMLRRDVVIFGRRLFQGQAHTDHVETYAPRIFAAVLDLKFRETLSLLHA